MSSRDESHEQSYLRGKNLVSVATHLVSQGKITDNQPKEEKSNHQDQVEFCITCDT